MRQIFSVSAVDVCRPWQRKENAAEKTVMRKFFEALRPAFRAGLK